MMRTIQTENKRKILQNKQLIEKKLSMSNLVLSKGELAITELDNDQLKELFSLRKDYLEV